MLVSYHLTRPFSPQLIAELQTSVCDSKEEAVRLQQAMEKQLEEASDRWDQERRTITHRADQANKVSVRHSLNHACMKESRRKEGK